MAMALFCLLVRFVVIAVAALTFAAAGVVMVVIALVVLAFMAAETASGRATCPRACAGSFWSATAATRSVRG
jgi:hypothetical protein